MLKKLDKILLSENIVEKFYENYKNKDFKDWLLDILPEIENCKNLKQDNPWHIYNCLDHILHAVEAINKLTKNYDQGTRRLLSYTMFLHDMGKPECYIRRYSKLYGREVDSFFDHNLAGVKIAERVLCQFGFAEKEIKIIKTLVEHHDIFMFIRLVDDGNPHHQVLTKSLIEKYVNQFNALGDGAQLLYFLTLVGIADNKAQNPKMTGASLEMLSVFQKMLKESYDIAK